MLEQAEALRLSAVFPRSLAGRQIGNGTAQSGAGGHMRCQHYVQWHYLLFHSTSPKLNVLKSCFWKVAENTTVFVRFVKELSSSLFDLSVENSPRIRLSFEYLKFQNFHNRKQHNSWGKCLCQVCLQVNIWNAVKISLKLNEAKYEDVVCKWLEYLVS